MGGNVLRRLGRVLRSREYYGTLRRLHEELRPSAYVEIGIRKGDSLALADSSTACVGIDPEPLLKRQPGPNAHVFAMTSDDFFARHDLREELGGRAPDLAFVDGMHLFEYVLRDFANIERYAAPHTVTVLHDCIPCDALSAARDRTTSLWMGDVWKAAFVLKRFRPELRLSVIDVGPSGLLLVEGLDPASRTLSEGLDAIVDEYLPLGYDYFLEHRGEIEALSGDVDSVIGRARAVAGTQG